MTVLIAAIPTPDLISHIVERYGEGVKLFVSETRPFEEHVARQVAAAAEGGCRVTLCTDNMVGSLLQNRDVDAVWSLYSERDAGGFTAVNGALLCAILAKEHGVPFLLFHHPEFPRAESGRFAGLPVAVEGAGYIDHELDRVPAGLVAEVV